MVVSWGDLIGVVGGGVAWLIASLIMSMVAKARLLTR